MKRKFRHWRPESWPRILRLWAQRWCFVRRRGPLGWWRTAVSWPLEARLRRRRRSFLRCCIGRSSRPSSLGFYWSCCCWGRTRCWWPMTTRSGRSPRECCRCLWWVGWRLSWRNQVLTANCYTTNRCHRSTANCRPRRRCLPSRTGTVPPLPHTDHWTTIMLFSVC